MRRAAKLAEEEVVVGGLTVHDDEISGERHIELAEVPRTSEEYREEDEAPPVYAPRT